MKKPKKFIRLNKIEKKPHKKTAAKVHHEVVARKNYWVPFIVVGQIILVCLFVAYSMLNWKIEREIVDIEYRLNEKYNIQLVKFPFLNFEREPDFSAKAVILKHVGSETVIYAKNERIKFSIASLTKLMTALTAADYFDDADQITIFTPVVEGSNIGFLRDEKYYFKDLLLAMFLPSSNEAAYAIAENFPGGREIFVAKMNEKAIELGLSETHFTDPAGLNDDGNYSTPFDLARLAEHIIENPRFSKLVSTRETFITEIGGIKTIRLVNLNKLLGIEGIDGIKTGTTEAAGEALAVSMVRNDERFVAIILKSEQRFVDTLNLVNMLNGNLSFVLPDELSKTEVKLR